MPQIVALSRVIAAIGKARKKYSRGFARGLLLAGLFLQRKSQEIVPVDTGTLRSSAFTRKEGSGLETVVVVGYTAYYAIYVHENLEAAHAEGTQAKFLEQPARVYRKELSKIIVEEARKG